MGDADNRNLVAGGRVTEDPFSLCLKTIWREVANKRYLKRSGINTMRPVRCLSR